MQIFKKQKRSVVVALALGITDRPERWHTPGKFLVKVCDGLKRFGIECHYATHPDVKLKWLNDRDAVRMDDQCDLEPFLKRRNAAYVLVWNGNSPGDRTTVEIAQANSIQPIFGEIGWFPQAETLYFDLEGTNFRSSIRKIDLSKIEPDPRIDAWVADYVREHRQETVEERDYLFVPLQDEDDTNITDASPYQHMNDFVRALAGRFPNERLVVRRHPRFMQVALDDYPNVVYRNDGNLYDWVENAKGIIGINSTVLLESLLYDRPVYAVGQGLASGLGAFFDYPSVDAIELVDGVDEETHDNRRKLLTELVFRRMLQREDLDRPEAIAEYFIFKEIIDALNPGAHQQSWSS